MWLSCGSFLVAVAGCVLIDPPDWIAHDGFSFYGNFRSTIIPYGIGLTASAFFLLQATRHLRDSEAARAFRLGLQCIGIGLLGIVVTPSYSQIKLIDDLHVLFGLVIFVTQAVLSLRYLIRVRGDWLDWLLLGLQLVAIVLVGLSFRRIHIVSVMLPAQVLAIVAFMSLLIRAVSSRTKLRVVIGSS